MLNTLSLGEQPEMIDGNRLRPTVTIRKTQTDPLTEIRIKPRIDEAGASRFGSILRGPYLEGNTGLMGEQGRKWEPENRDARAVERNLAGTAW